MDTQLLKMKTTSPRTKIYSVEFGAIDEDNDILSYNFKDKNLAKKVYSLMIKYNPNKKHKIRLVIHPTILENSYEVISHKHNDTIVINDTEDKLEDIVYLTHFYKDEEENNNIKIFDLTFPESVACCIGELVVVSYYENDCSEIITFNPVFW